MDEYPVGFGITLSMNPKAMDNFTSMPEENKQKVIEHTHYIRSKEEMQAFVQNIADGKEGS